MVEPLPPLFPPERAAVERVVLRAAVLRRVVVVRELAEAVEDAAEVEAVTGVTSMVVWAAVVAAGLAFEAAGVADAFAAAADDAALERRRGVGVAMT